MKLSGPGAPTCPAQAAHAAAPAGDIASHLATLDQLRAAGEIGDEEYRVRRTKILDRL
ncbi:SHOCT domain-containing protein [Streptomyces coeruleorubidus]|uniref:SHOCT domain-containing protein n=1 Tax=Streptomyces coeruleorubidus TaxID=116188 RepID=UPI0037003DE9